MFPRKVKSSIVHIAFSNPVRLFLIVILTVIVTDLTPAFATAKIAHGIAQKRSNNTEKRAKQFVCGYEPLGVTDELSNHHAHKFDLSRRGTPDQLIKTRTKGVRS